MVASDDKDASNTAEQLYSHLRKICAIPAISIAVHISVTTIISAKTVIFNSF